MVLLLQQLLELSGLVGQDAVLFGQPIGQQSAPEVHLASEDQRCQEHGHRPQALGDVELGDHRAELYEFFGGDLGTDLPMKMTWHHLAFNEAAQVGFGEYTFQMHGRYHGIVVVKIEAGLIKHWREYQYRSESSWEDFTSRNPF